MRSTVESVHVELPAEFDCADYLMYNPDLSGLSDEALREHYEKYGMEEGRRANSVATRNDFAAIVPPGAEVLEIGPSCAPLLRGPRTKYFDVLPRSALIELAEPLDIPSSEVPEIDYLSPIGDLGIVDRQFDFALSSHCIEHQPDLVSHLCNVERILRPGGCYFLLVPDKRYCFDHFLAESTLAEVLAAYDERRTRHSLKSLLEHRVLTTHNENERHWAADHGSYMENFEYRTMSTLSEWHTSDGSYLDVHAWYFTPAGAKRIFSALATLEFTDLTVERVYPTRFGSNEFWMVLRK
jgi:SAM-dependent methyltransferase